MVRIASLLAIALVALAGRAWPLSVQTIEPRPFGYTVGDVLERRVLVDRAQDGTVDPASLPRPGRSSRWFQLREAASGPDGVRLRYQIVNTPLQPERENLPSLRLRVIGPDGRARQADIGPFTVALAPVAQFGPNDVIQSDNLRPDLDPEPIDTSRRRAWVLGCGAALAALSMVIVAPVAARRLSGRRSGPFARAARALRRLVPAQDAAARDQALRRLHAALDEAAGRTLALDNVDQLFQLHPWLAPARIKVEALLADSRAAFFGNAPAPAPEHLEAVAAELADLERRR